MKVYRNRGEWLRVHPKPVYGPETLAQYQARLFMASFLKDMRPLPSFHVPEEMPAGSVLHIPRFERVTHD